MVIFGPKRDDNGEWRRLHNEELHSWGYFFDICPKPREIIEENSTRKLLNVVPIP